MPPLLHGLEYRAQYSDISNDLVPVETSEPQRIKAPTLVAVGVPASFVDPPAHTSSAANASGIEFDVKDTAKGVFKDIDATTKASQPRKRAPRVVYTLGGPSPFPSHPGPTATACQHVHDLLSAQHEKREMPSNVPPPSQSIAGCGEVNFVLEALIRTIISTHTHMSNADKAIKNVCAYYPVFQHGDFAGSVDWNAVRIGGAERLEEAIRPAGKAKTTSTAIMTILESVKNENDLKRMELLSGTCNLDSQKALLMTRAEILSVKAYEMLVTTPDFLTLDYLHTVTAKDAFERLQQFPGVGVKTAACIILFCFQYPAFAVDTHVWRLSKLLGWVPASANRDQTFFHLDPIVPDELKYGLHQLFIAHGKACARCSGRSKKNTKSIETDVCVLEDLMTRSNLDKVPLKKKQGIKASSQEEHEEDDILDNVPMSAARSGLDDWPYEDYDQTSIPREGIVNSTAIQPNRALVGKKRNASDDMRLIPHKDLRRSKRIATLMSAQDNYLIT